MILTITILTSLLFSVLYPLCFWISGKAPLKNNFHHFHSGLPCVIGGITLVGLISMGISQDVLRLIAIWMGTLLFITYYYWNRETVSLYAVTAVSLLGLTAYYQVQSSVFVDNPVFFPISIIAGGILCSVLFAMNLGHWYLNVHGLPIVHLVRAVHTLRACLVLRLIWDAWQLANQRIIYGGDPIDLWMFMTKLDGFFLLIALFFGTVFPLVSLYFVYGTLKLKNTQATTGILYVLLCSILIGDLTYKYYQFKFGIVM